MDYIVTLHLKSGLEIEYLLKVTFEGKEHIHIVRKHVEHELSLSDTWLSLDDDVSVKRSEVDYFKVKEAE